MVPEVCRPSRGSRPAITRLVLRSLLVESDLFLFEEVAQFAGQSNNTSRATSGFSYDESLRSDESLRGKRGTKNSLRFLSIP